MVTLSTSKWIAIKEDSAEGNRRLQCGLRCVVSGLNYKKILERAVNRVAVDAGPSSHPPLALRIRVHATLSLEAWQSGASPLPQSFGSLLRVSRVLVSARMPRGTQEDYPLGHIFVS